MSDTSTAVTSNIAILVVADGKVSFAPERNGRNYFGMSELMNTLTAKFRVIKAHRDKDPGEAPGVREIFEFTAEALKGIGQIWLFGMHGPDRSLSDQEVSVITDFMKKGGGVFATGDHWTLGAGLSGRIPHVKEMRAWTEEQCVPPEKGNMRNDTLRPRHPGESPRKLHWRNQSDSIPQEIYPVMLPLDKPVTAHPLLLKAGSSKPDAIIRVLPDHMHEGVVLKDIVAYGVVAAHDTDQYSDMGYTHPPRMFGVIGAKEVSAQGRVVVDSTWHHFFDINLIGDTTGRTIEEQQGFTYNAAGKEVLADIQNYYRNIGLWLAPLKTRGELFLRAVEAVSRGERALPMDGMPSESDLAANRAPQSVGYGALEVLAAELPAWAIGDGLRAFLGDGELPPAPWSEAVGAAPHALAYDAAVTAALGGAVLAHRDGASIEEGIRSVLASLTPR